MPLGTLEIGTHGVDGAFGGEARRRVLDADERHEAVHALRRVTRDAGLGQQVRPSAPSLGRREAVMDHANVVPADLEHREGLIQIREEGFDRFDGRPGLLVIDERRRLMGPDEDPTSPRHRRQHAP